MKNDLPISPKKKFKYSITFQSFDEETFLEGDYLDNGFEVEDDKDTIGEILYKANTTYGIYMPVSFGTWESTEPLENRDFFEKGIRKYFALHLTNEDGTEISQEENDFISYLLSDGRYEIDKFRDYAVGGIVLGAVALGVGALITYFYFKDKKVGNNKKELVSKTAKSVTYRINGKDRKFPIKDAWKKEHSSENKSENYEVPQEDRFKMGGEIIFFDRHASMDESTRDELTEMTNYPYIKEYDVEENGAKKYDRIESELKKEGVSVKTIDNYLSGLYDGYNYSNTDGFKNEMAKLKLVDNNFYNKIMEMYDKVSKYPTIDKKFADGGETKYFNEFMLEYKIFENGSLKEFKTIIENKLSSITEFIDNNNLTLKDNDYRIKGLKNGKWQLLVSNTKFADGGGVSKISIRDIDWSNEENHKLGVWLLTRPDGNIILAKSNNANDLEKFVMAYAKKRGSVAKMKYNSEDFTEDSEADDGLSWVTFGDLWEEVKSLGKEKKFSDGGGVENVIVYDNDGETFDRYTIFTPDGGVYGMSDNALMPNGFNQYLGDNSEVKKGSHLGKKLKEIPESIKVAVERRMNEYSNGGDIKGNKIPENSKIRINYVSVSVYKDSYEEGETENVNNYNLNYIDGNLVSPKELVNFLSKNIYTSEDSSDYVILDNNIHTSQLQDADGSEASKSEIEEWKKGNLELYSANFVISVSIISEIEFNEQTLSSLTGIGIYKEGGEAGRKSVKKPIRKKRQPKVARTQFEEETYDYAKGGSIDLSTKEKAVMYSWVDNFLEKYSGDDNLSQSLDMYDEFSKKFNKSKEQTHDIIDKGWAKSRGYDKGGEADDDEFNEAIVTDLYDKINGKKIRTQNQKSIKEAIESANENSKYYKGYAEVYIGAIFVGFSKNGNFKYSSRYKGDKYAEGGSLKNLKNIAKKYLENEDDNNHSENVVLLATHFGTKEDLKKAKEILALHNSTGSLTSENGKARQQLHLKLISKARKEMSKEGVEFADGGSIDSDLEKLEEIHEKIREILIENGSEEYGDFIVDEISEAVGISNTNAYYDEDEEYVKPKKVILKGSASKKDLKKLEEIHEKIREILIENGNEEYGDFVIDQISDVVGIPTTIAYYNDEEFADGGEVGDIVEVELNNGKLIKGKIEKTNPFKIRTDSTSVQTIPNALIKSINKIDEEFEEGGEIQDWMEEALALLIEETGNEGLDITMVSNYSNEFFAGNDMEEYRVFKTEEDAENTAIEQVREDMKEYPENFKQDWLKNYINGRDFFEQSLNEMNRIYAEDIASESDSKYANRLIAEMVDNGIMNEDDALSGNAEELADYYMQDFVNVMTESQLDEGNDGLDYFVSNFGEETTYKMVLENNLIDIDEASKDAVNIDGIGNFLFSYDGETLYLSNDYVAYRTN